VGAHWGSALAPFAKAGWKVYCFEPDSGNRKRLAYLFGKFSNVVIDQRAVSDHPKENAVLYKSEESSGISGLSAFRDSHRPAGKIEVTTLGHFFEERDLGDGQVDVLKVDTEGFDFHVLKGFPWEKCRPRVILCEFEDQRTIPLGYTFHDLAIFLQEKGYRLMISEWWPVKAYNTPHQWRRFMPYPCEINDPKGWGNLFGVRDEGLYHSLIAKIAGFQLPEDGCRWMVDTPVK
jgi:FkbM family methyltransferase